MEVVVACLEALFWNLLGRTVINLERLNAVCPPSVDRCIGNELGGNVYGRIEVLSRHLRGGTEEDHENPLSMVMFLPRFEPSLLEYKKRSYGPS